MVKFQSSASTRKLNLRTYQGFPSSDRLPTTQNKLGWRLALWPNSPVLKKITEPEHGISKRETNESQNEEDGDTRLLSFGIPKRNNRSLSDFSGCRTRNEKPLGDNMVDLCDSENKLSFSIIKPFVKSSLSSTCEVQDSFKIGKTLQHVSLYQELEEFMGNMELHSLTFPDYFSEEERNIVQEASLTLNLGCHSIGEHTLVVYKFNSIEKKRVHPAVWKSPQYEPPKDDVYVDVPELAQQGKDNFISVLRLQRFSSSSGTRRKMLWDVAQLSSTDGFADPVKECKGGVYAVQSRSSGQKLAMFKPAEEEKFVRDGLFPGEGAVREEAAYELDSRYHGFSGVPATAVARLHLTNIGQTKSGSVQRFMIGSIGNMEDFGMPFDLTKAQEFVSVDQVHRVGLLDVRLFNTDRHSGNILLIGEQPPYAMVPIDHGCILPSWFHLSEARFDWLEYPQCKVPFTLQALEYIEALDAETDAIALRRLGIREECIVTLKICTLFLKLAARNGKTLFWMGSFMQRTGCYENPSRLEVIVKKVCDVIGIPFTFTMNEFNEWKGHIPLGILSRRPPKIFYKYLELFLQEAIDQRIQMLA